MHARYIDGITIRPLRDGDTATVAAVFARLGARSREQRFCGAEAAALGRASSSALARVDGDHHVLVAFVDGDPSRRGWPGSCGTARSAEIAFEVADAHQGRGIGSVLAQELAADARAAGITELRRDGVRRQPAVVSLLRRVADSLHVSWQGREREFVLGLEG